MSTWQLIGRSLRHYWRTNLGVLLGAACATAILVGAMVVGDSVRHSLHQQASHRIGQVSAARVSGDRFFRADLADRIADDTTVAPVLQMQGVVSAAGSSARTGIVDVFGIDERFFALAPSGAPRQAPRPGTALLNGSLTAQLGANTGDTILLRVERPSALPRDMVLATIEDLSFALRIEVAGVLDEADFGRFGLRASQVAPFNLFVSLPWLATQLELEGRANMLLCGAGPAVKSLNANVQARWSLADAELEVRADANFAELTSPRVFLDEPVVDAARQLLGSQASDTVAVLTYFINELRSGDRATPYSMVTAIGAFGGDQASALSFLPIDLGANDIVLNEWVARDLRASVGDTVELTYFVMGEQLALGEETRAFVVGAIVPLTGPAADPSLMPPFPGLADQDSCRDWEPGIPIDLQRIRDEDEQYWDDHRGTPKAFISLATGREIWGNRFGSLTALRAPMAAADKLRQRLGRTLDPARLGLFFQDVRGAALASGTSATDFGGLFLGLSFFLILAALLLTALLFVFGVEQRAREIGTLLAVGLPPNRVWRIFFGEALLLATLGGIAGAALGLLYTEGVLLGLGTLWRDAVGATTLTFHASVGTVATAAGAAVLTAIVAMALTLRRTFDHSAVDLLASRSGIPRRMVTRGARRGRASLIMAALAALSAIALMALASASAAQAAGAFFGAGALLLIAMLALCRRLLTGLGAPSAAGINSIAGLGMRNSGRRPGRSLATIALLASGTFLVVAVQANRLEPPADPTARASGTGGFALFGRSTLPVLRDLGTPEGRSAYALDEEQLRDTTIVPLRVRDGDDASCLNLSLPQNPRLVALQPAALAERGAFAFADSQPPDGAAAPASPWSLLDADYGPDVVPAIGDAASITWAMHKSLGDSLDYVDEAGRPFGVRLVGSVTNSILQGNLVIAESHFERRFPSASGYRMFLIDAPAVRTDQVAADLTRAMADIGLELTSARERLAAFNAVQNTYLLIFQALGGLGLLLGSVGMGMVVLRNTLERRQELAIASALGFSPRCNQKVVWSEHGLLLALGLGSGLVAALAAVLPTAAGGASTGTIALLVLVVAFSGALWVWLATALAMRGPVLDALRGE